MKQREINEKNEKNWKIEFNKALKKASVKDIAKLTDRLSLPKNYTRMRYGAD